MPVEVEKLTTLLSTGSLATFVGIAVYTYTKGYWYTGREYKALEKEHATETARTARVVAEEATRREAEVERERKIAERQRADDAARLEAEVKRFAAELERERRESDEWKGSALKLLQANSTLVSTNRAAVTAATTGQPSDVNHP